MSQQDGISLKRFAEQVGVSGRCLLNWRQCQRGTARSACRKALATGAARSACHRPAAASLAYQPDSRHRRQSLPNEACLAEFARLLPQAPAVSCKAAFDFVRGAV